jgi:hypothetical protein
MSEEEEHVNVAIDGSGVAWNGDEILRGPQNDRRYVADCPMISSSASESVEVVKY